MEEKGILHHYSLNLKQPPLHTDKFTENMEQLPPNLQYTEPSKEAFIFNNLQIVPNKALNRRDVGTETTPLVSSKTSQCPTPIISTSPVRHNTPEGRYGPLDPCNPRIVSAPNLKDCGFIKFDLNWPSKQEEEKVSKSLRHFEMSCENKNMVDSTGCAWEEEEKAKSCIRSEAKFSILFFYFQNLYAFGRVTVFAIIWYSSKYWASCSSRNRF
jgi:hypothetical protein